MRPWWIMRHARPAARLARDQGTVTTEISGPAANEVPATEAP
jgi:hypothetical protein